MMARTEKGFVLVVVMVILILVTTIGVLAITQSGTLLKITGNRRVNTINFFAGESGIDFSPALIESVSFERAVPQKYASFTIASDVVNEIIGENPDLSDTGDSAETAPDVQFSVDQNNVSVDIDYLYATTAAGGSIEYASGYEGVGKSVAQGGALVYYRVNVISEGVLASQDRIGGLYRYVTK